ncbi:signal peptidase I, partial [Candidatus Saccharibacteria bacterium]|nr:signal peptidase I [Candidatus Saccharibacteria bacterium]
MANKQTYTTAEEIDAMRERIANAKLKGTKKHSKLLPILGGTLFTIVVLLLVGILITVNIAKRQGKTPDLFGYRLFMVETGSME